MIDEKVLNLMQEFKDEFSKDEKVKFEEIIEKVIEEENLNYWDYDFLEMLIEKCWVWLKSNYEYKKLLLENASQQFEIYKEIIAEGE